MNSTTTKTSVGEWITDATATFDAAEKAWTASLRDAFGTAACERRYDMDQSTHPEACQRLHTLRALAQTDYTAAWNAQYAAWRQERLQ